MGVWSGGSRVGLFHRGDLPAGPRSVFEIGSITKVFTATLLADMAREGLLGIDDRVSLHLPPGVEMPSRGREITLADLASHRSGLPALPRGLLLGALTTPAARPVRALGRRPARGGDPADPSAAGAGGTLPLLELRRRAARSRARAARRDQLRRARARRICEPLGLAQTGTTVDGGRLATGHTRRGRVTSHWHLAALAGAGGLRSTAADLLGFLRLHSGGAGSTPLALAARETHRARARAGRLYVGLGWLIAPPSRRIPHELLLHEGGTGGFRSFAAVTPRAEIAVVVLANQARSVGSLGLRLVRAVMAEASR